MRDIAAEAAVAVPTVEAAFGTKARLLKAAIDTAIAGDEAPVPMLERAWAARARAAPDATTVVAEFAGTLTASAQRAAGLVLAALDAARLDPDIAEVAAQLTRQREIMAAWLVDELTDRSSLRHGISGDEAIDTVWLLMDPAVFTRLTGQRKWPAMRFRCLVHRHSHPAATRPRARSALNGTGPPGHPPCFNQCPGVSDRLDMAPGHVP